MEIKIFKEPKSLSTDELHRMAAARFGDMVKAVVDVERKVLGAGGGLHADIEALLLEEGSKQEHLWGINIYIDRLAEERIEFDSMINVRPAQKNRSRAVESPAEQEKIRAVVETILV
jgi:hypothetical protein